MYRTREHLISDAGLDWNPDWEPLSGVINGHFLLVRMSAKKYAAIYKSPSTFIRAESNSYAGAMALIVKLSKEQPTVAPCLTR